MTNMDINPDRLQTTESGSLLPQEVEKKQQTNAPQTGIISGLFGPVVQVYSWCTSTISRCLYGKEVDELSKDELSETDKKIELLGPTNQDMELKELTEVSMDEKVEEVAEKIFSTIEPPEDEMSISPRIILKELDSQKNMDMAFDPEMLTIAGKIKSLEVVPAHFAVLDELAAKENRIILEFTSALEIADVAWMNEAVQELREANFSIRPLWERVVTELSKKEEHVDQYQLASGILDKFDDLLASDKTIDEYEAFSVCLDSLDKAQFEYRMIGDFQEAMEGSDINRLQKLVSDAKIFELPIVDLWVRASEAIGDTDSVGNIILEKFDSLMIESSETMDQYDAFTLCLHAIDRERVADTIVTGFKAAIDIVDVSWLNKLVTESKLHKLPIADLWERATKELHSEDAHSLLAERAGRILNRFKALNSVSTGLDEYKLFEACFKPYENKFISEENMVNEVQRRLKRD